MNAWQKTKAVHMSVLSSDLKLIGFEYATKSGFSVATADMIIPPDKNKVIDDAQSEIDKGVEIKLSKQARVMDIVKIVMDVLKHENWGVYYKNQPMQPLEMQDGAPLYKIYQVDDDDIERALINTLTKGESWKHSETNLNQKKT